MYILLIVVHFLLPSFVFNFDVSIEVHHNNAIDIADTTNTHLDEQRPCSDEEVFDTKMNQCVRFACPPNFKVSREENKCKPMRQPNTNIVTRSQMSVTTQEKGVNFAESLKKFTGRLLDYSLQWLNYFSGSRYDKGMTS